MQAGHPRHKQIQRAKRDMYLHKRRKAEEMAEAFKATFRLIGEAAYAAGRAIAKYFNNTH